MTNEEMKAYAATHPEVRWQFWNTHHAYWQTVRKGGTPQWKPDVKYRLKPGQSSVAQAKAKMAKTRAEIVEKNSYSKAAANASKELGVLFNPGGKGIVADAPWNAVNRAAADAKKDADDPFRKMGAVLTALGGITQEDLYYSTTRRDAAALIDKLRAALK